MCPSSRCTKSILLQHSTTSILLQHYLSVEVQTLSFFPFLEATTILQLLCPIPFCLYIYCPCLYEKNLKALWKDPKTGTDGKFSSWIGRLNITDLCTTFPIKIQTGVSCPNQLLVPELDSSKVCMYN